MAAWIRLPVLLALWGLTGCALQPVEALPANACLRHFQAVDGDIEAADARDHGAHRPAGFPWLRSTRFTASFSGELKSQSQWQAWLERLRLEDMTARRVELVNAGIAHRQGELRRLAACGRQLNAALLADKDARQQLLDGVVVPDDYSLLQRLFGAYPLALPFLKAGVGDYHTQVQSGYRQPVDALPVKGTLHVWRPPVAEPGRVALANLSRDSLGIPRLHDGQVEKLVAQHAPLWWLDSAGDYDRPGWPQPGDAGPDVDSGRPVVFYDHSYTRLADQVLLQLVYVIWFDRRPVQSILDPYAGNLDGVVWRVTLDSQGQPLFYDSIHACGCYHRIYPAQPMQPAQLEWGQEPWLLPQADVPNPPLALRLESGTHYLQRVVSVASLPGHRAEVYALEPYPALLSQPDGQGGYRSLFSGQGLVQGTERSERWWLWPSGVRSPGAMRQQGRHAIAFVGMRHFDDPFLAQRLTGHVESGK